MGGPRVGRVLENRGRRVNVRSDGEDVVCFLSGQRAVVGDEVTFVDAKGGGGKLVSVARRRTSLVRVGHNGREQVLAANLEGLFVVVAPQEPPFRAGLVDRYAVAAAAQGLRVCVVVNKCDQGVPPDVEAALALREAHGIDVIRASALLRFGLDAIRAHAAQHDAGPWALVGHSGVGKTSLIGALLPGVDVGAIGELSEYWGTGQHTTTGSRLFPLPGGGELLDSPGIRTFTPGGLTVDTVRTWFPGLPQGVCRYRDCQHREGEDGCGVVDIDPELLASYRRLLEDVRGIGSR
ncbi:MAG: ribosome small subunit-dependent GTPase A [Alphaproteobacteria bacterium]|nr:ribosome small subunit-dependent GTPase A [Alphaproteobacteria bacterium]MCB9694056.1 ribosome small subunit-dependent GTPase A [Alphaproteobacteria bacterium]